MKNRKFNFWSAIHRRFAGAALFLAAAFGSTTAQAIYPHDPNDVKEWGEWSYCVIESGEFANQAVLVKYNGTASVVDVPVHIKESAYIWREIREIKAAFANNKEITHISMPRSVRVLNKAFYNCPNLVSVSFDLNPNNWFEAGSQLQVITADTFRDCAKLASFSLPWYIQNGVACSQVISIGDNAFKGCTSLTSIDLTAPIPAPLLQSIGNNAFEGCTGLVSAKIGGDGQQGLALGSQLFYGCTNLETVTLGPAVASVAVSGTTDPSGGMFYNCNKLDTVKLQTIRLQSIPNYMFSQSGVRFVELPEATYAGEAYTTVGRGAFNRCQRLEAVYERNVGGKFKPTAVGENAFNYCSAMTGRVDLARCKSIGDHAFNYCGKMPGDLDLRQLNSIGISAFFGAKAITSVEFGDLWNFASSVFDGCGALTNAVIDGVGLEFGGPETFTFFKGCTNLLKAVFGPGVKLGVRSQLMLSGYNISIFCSVNCKLKEVEFQHPEPMDIPYACFENLAELRRVSFAGGVRSLKTRAFWGCKKLETIEGTFAPLDVGVNAFFDCQMLENTANFDLSQCTNIANQAFHSCTKFGGTVQLSSLETIGYNAFLGCKSLERVENMGTVTNLMFGVFSSCEKLTEVTFPETLTKIDGSVIRNSPSLSKITFLGAPPLWTETMWLNCTNRVEIAYPAAHAAAWATVQAEGMIKNSGSGGVLVYVQIATPTPPDAGFDDFVRDICNDPNMTDEECQAKLNEVGTNGYTWYASYVAGLDPEDENSKLVAKIEMDENGQPVVTAEPDLGTVRVYTTLGAKDLASGEWVDMSTVQESDKDQYRFFKVTVDLPQP